ncbi:hypothetical protein [Nocardia sp. NBC_01329]|uniref:hypothetical protein n=1 Tax=Nocardia sp. NBC_01329 TaxID=2903594 RepID=UPI002E121AE0|nr:hypothetical protein OG405_20155 [Nocardia sp. NBC_01329]
MGLFDSIVSPVASGVGGWVADNWDTIAVSAASVAGFAVGGPLGAALAGAAVGGLTAGIQDEDVGAAVLMGGLGGVFGGIGGAALRGGLSAAGRTALSNFSKRSVTALARGRLGGGGVRGSLSAYRKSVQRQIPNRVSGSLGAGFGAGLGYWQETSDWAPSDGGEDSGFAEIPVIPIGDEERPEGMPQVLMPDSSDTASPPWPSDLTFSEPMQQNYKTLPGVYKDILGSFGKDPTETSLPEEVPLPGKIKDPEKAGIPNYAQRAGDLEVRFENIRGFDDQVAKTVERTVEYCDEGKGVAKISVRTVGDFAKVHPENIEGIKAAVGAAEAASPNVEVPVFLFPQTYGADGNLTEDSYVLSIMEGSYAGIESIMSHYAKLFDELAAATEKPDDESNEKPGNEKPGDQNRGDPNTTPGIDTPQPVPAPDAQETPLEPPKPIDLGDTDDSSSGSKADEPGKSAREALEQLGKDAAATGTGPGAGQPPQIPANANAAGSGMESMMLPMLMQAMMGMGAKQQPGQQPDDRLRRRRREDEAGPEQAPAIAPVPSAPQPAAPAATPPGTPTPPARVSAPPVAPPVQAGAGKPAGTSQDNVMYTFPDGRTQEVSAVVGRALDAAFDNAGGTDAAAAYTNTPAKWTDEKKIGPRVDPHQLMTGDVGVWDDRTALLVVFGTDTSGTLEAVVDGQLQPVTGPEDMRDGQGEFGQFVGFFHPPGIEKAAPASEAADAAVQPAAADPTVATAPA